MTQREAKRNVCLNDDEIRDFFDVGWVVRRGLFSEHEVSLMRDCFDRLEAIAAGLSGTGMHAGSYFVLGAGDSGRGRIIERVVWAGASQPYLLSVGSDPRLTAPSAQLLQSKAMDHLLSQAHFKRPGDGVVFGWHQDIEHRDKGDGTWSDVNGSGSFVQTVIVLDEMTPDSGPLLFMPGSAKWGRLARADRGLGNPCRAVDSLACPSPEPVTIEASPGDTLFFGPYTVHGSFENRSDRYRRVLINGYVAPGANRRRYPGSGTGRRLVSGGPAHR